MTCRGAVPLGLALALTFLSTPPGWADDQMQVGIGHKGCRDALKTMRTIDSQDRTLLGQWSQGYLSGRNAPTQSELAVCRAKYRPLPEMNAMLKWAEQYCSRNPDQEFKMAIDVLFDSLPKKEFSIPNCKSKKSQTAP